MTTPSQPMGASFAIASNCVTPWSNSFRVTSLATVQFIVQSSCNQAPVEEQNAASNPWGSITGVSEAP